MSCTFIILLMVFFHIVDDYYLQVQGFLATGKQKKYWKEVAPARMYKYDYIWALIMHSFSWTFMIMLPIAFTMNFNISHDGIFISMFVVNLVIHALVDDLKANQNKINLIQDQMIHMLQIGFTSLVCLRG